MFLMLCYQNIKSTIGGRGGRVEGKGDLRVEDPHSDFFANPNVIDKKLNDGYNIKSFAWRQYIHGVPYLIYSFIFC